MVWFFGCYLISHCNFFWILMDGLFLPFKYVWFIPKVPTWNLLRAFLRAGVCVPWIVYVSLCYFVRVHSRCNVLNVFEKCMQRHSKRRFNGLKYAAALVTYHFSDICSCPFYILTAPLPPLATALERHRLAPFSYFVSHVYFCVGPPNSMQRLQVGKKSVCQTACE